METGTKETKIEGRLDMKYIPETGESDIKIFSPSIHLNKMTVKGA